MFNYSAQEHKLADQIDQEDLDSDFDEDFSDDNS